MSEAKRYNEGKVPLSLVLESKAAMEGLARVFEMGAKKYGRDNWKKGFPDDTVIIDSLMRHTLKAASGEVLDEESGLPHADHIQANAYFLSHFTHERLEANKDPLEASEANIKG